MKPRITPPNGVRIHVAGIDLVRDEQGSFRVLEDNLRSRQGLLRDKNRRTMASLPEPVRPVGCAVGDTRRTYCVPCGTRRQQCRRSDGGGADAGRHSSAYFEHSLLARQMGVELVEGRDLFCRDNTVYMRTTEGRAGSASSTAGSTMLDPMQFRPDSVLGVAGLLNAARAERRRDLQRRGQRRRRRQAGLHLRPDDHRYYLGEKPLRPTSTFRCWLDTEREVLDGSTNW